MILKVMVPIELCPLLAHARKLAKHVAKGVSVIAVLDDLMIIGF